DGYYSKGFLLQQDGTLIYDNKIDISSLYGVFAFSGLDITDYRIQSTIKAVEKRILNRSPSGGVIRYEYDGYYLSKNQYPGNPWGVTTLLLSQVYIANNEINKAKELLDWAIQKELSTGAMSEQYDPEDSTPIGVTPLVWSQAQMINTILDLKNK
ncbi:glycoside hydrolase family 15 protein, partial [bacterium]|nr:glycoside hydrolase family 15 protein [bacterium]